MADDLGRRHHRALGVEVVGDVQKAAHQRLVALDALGQRRLAPGGRRRRALDHEAALGADRHDDGVLDHLRLHQPEDLRAEILAAVGPADAAARHLAAAQMDALHPRAVDEHLDHRAWQRQVVDVAAVDLEGDVGLGPPVRAVLVGVGAQRVAQQVEEAPQDAVLVQVPHPVEGALDLGRQPRIVLRAAGRVEAAVEQGDQLARDGRMAGQRAFHHVLPIGDAGLAQILGVGAQHRHLPRGQAGAKDEAVEAVILHPAVPDGGEGVLELLLHHRAVDGQPVLRPRGEVVNPHRGGVAGDGDLEGRFGDHLQVHVLQHGQHVGQRHRAAFVVDLDVQLVPFGLQRAVEVDAQRALGRRLLDPLDVEDGGLRVELLAVGGGEGVGVAAEQGAPLLLAVGLDQRVAQMVVPAARRLDQPRLQIGGVDGGHAARLGLDDEMQAGQHAFGQLRGEAGAGAVVGGLQDGLDAPAQRGVVAVARHVDEAGGEALERVLAHEQGQPLPLLQVQNADRDVQQLRHLDLEQLVARVGLQDVQKRLAVMALRVEAGQFHHLRDLAAEVGDLARAAVVGDRGEEAGDQPLADDPPLGVEALDEEGVHRHRAVHGGGAVALGHHQDARVAQEVAHVGRQGGVVAQPVEDGDGVVAQDAETAAGDQTQRGVHPIGAALEAVFAVAEEGEMVVVGPGQEGLGLVHLVVGDDGRDGGTGAVGLGDGGAHLLAHGPPVGDGGAHVGQHALQPLAGLVERRGAGHRADLDMHEGFGGGVGGGRRRLVQLGELAVGVALDPHHGVDDQMDGQPLAVQLRGHRVDEEGHVVVDDLHHRAVGLPAMLLDAGVVDADLGAVGRLALLAPLPHGERGAVELLGRSLDDVVGRDVVVELPYEALRRCRAAAAQPLANLPHDLFGQLVLELFGPESHRSNPSLIFCGGWPPL